jgi:hypothetical protein
MELLLIEPALPGSEKEKECVGGWRREKQHRGEWRVSGLE